jgi:hypothetical protein
MMKMTIMLALALSAAPTALAAQTDPVPRDTVPTHVPVPPPPSFPAWPDNRPPTGSRGGDVVAGATEGALAGAVIGVAVYQQSPECAPGDSPGEAAAVGAGTGAVWGGLRALFLGRHRNRMPPVLVNTPVRQDRRRAGTSHPPVVNDRCLATVPPGNTDPTR